jgi:hypothetical protein
MQCKPYTSAQGAVLCFYKVSGIQMDNVIVLWCYGSRPTCSELPHTSSRLVQQCGISGD